MACTKADRRFDSIANRDMLRTYVKVRNFDMLMQHADLIRSNHIGFYDKAVFGDGWCEPHDRYFDPLHEAIRQKDVKMVEWLLDLGCPVMAVDSSSPGETAMHTACREGNLAMCKLLYARDARLATTMSFVCETPLMIACANGHLEIVKWLVLDCGVKVDEEPKLPADAKNRVIGMRNLFIQDENLPLFQAAFYGHYDIADWLVDSAGAQKPSFLARPNIREFEVPTPNYKYPFDDATRIVHYAAEDKKWQVLKWLFERRGIDPNCRANTNTKYMSHLHIPLTYAADQDNHYCVLYLLTLPNINVNKQICRRTLSSDRKDYVFVTCSALQYIAYHSVLKYRSDIQKAIAAKSRGLAIL